MGDTRTELLADEIAQKIRHRIQSQEYAQGERLTVRLLCKEFGASETPVKQALNQLVTTGLVVSIPKCGMRVRTFTFQDMKNNWEARLMIEQYCAAAAVDRGRRDEAFIEHMRTLLNRTNAAYDQCIGDYTKDNFNQLSEYDRQLHTELIRCCENDQIVNMYEGLNAYAGMFVGYTRHNKETLRGVQQEHTNIIHQLELCDVEGLRRALEQHVYSTIQIYRQSKDE